ncbi:MAG: AraC family transcriptional regulator [Flavobacteriaceae bacterium]
MVKKRRDFDKCEVVDLRGLSTTFSEEIAIKTSSHNHEGVVVNEFHVHPGYGHGHIYHCATEDIDLTMSTFKLNSDIVLFQAFTGDFIQISFLIEGEKIISLHGKNDVLYESGESYLANIKSFEGYSRIAGGRMFKEIKVRLSTFFLRGHGFVNDICLKELADDNLILPITDELLTVLTAIEHTGFIGMARKIYIKAKVFELLAIQIENYKKRSLKGSGLQRNKNLKKLYVIKKIIKENLHKNFSLGSLSKEAGLNQVFLNREFIRVFGYSIHQFSTEEKMKKAKMMLENTACLIYQIAEEVGYKNATHFSAAFRRILGETPKQYRARLLAIL